MHRAFVGHPAVDSDVMVLGGFGGGLLLSFSPATLKSDAANLLLAASRSCESPSELCFIRRAESAPGQYVLVRAQFSKGCCWPKLELQRYLLAGSPENQPHHFARSAQDAFVPLDVLLDPHNITHT